MDTESNRATEFTDKAFTVNYMRLTKTQAGRVRKQTSNTKIRNSHQYWLNY